MCRKTPIQLNFFALCALCYYVLLILFCLRDCAFGVKRWMFACATCDYILAPFEFRNCRVRLKKYSRGELPIKVRQSRVHGRGVFATKAIRKNARIIEYTGKRVAWESVPNDSDDAHTFLFGLEDGAMVIDPRHGGNDARWINHSCAPNCEAIEEDGRVFIYALRNIRPDEELFYDYRLEVDEPVTAAVAEESRCHCGTPRCRGTMLEHAPAVPAKKRVRFQA